MGPLEEAEVFLKRDLEFRQVLFESNQVAVVNTLVWLGNCSIKLGRLREAERIFRRALAISQSMVVPNDLSVASILSWLGPFLLDAGRPEKPSVKCCKSLRYARCKKCQTNFPWPLSCTG